MPPTPSIPPSCRPGRGRAAALLTGLGVALLVAGCGSGGGPAPSSAASGGTASPSTAATTPTTAGQPSLPELRDTWQQAVSVSLAATRFRADAAFDGVHVAAHGVALGAPHRSAFVLRYRTAAEQVDEHWVRERGAEYVTELARAPSGRTTATTGRCSIERTDASASRDAGSRVHLSGLPFALQTLADAEVVAPGAPGHVRVSAPLDDVLYAVGPLFARELRIDGPTRGQVPLDATLGGGRVTGWTASIGDVVDAAVLAGGRPDGFLTAHLDDLHDSVLTVRLAPARPADASSTTPPPRRLLVTDLAAAQGTPACGVPGHR